ncbi:MAG: enoyl-CoA hydratase-related protein [Bauldia sp.]
MVDATITTERLGRVVSLGLNRPRVKNALTLAMVEELALAVEAADRDRGVSVVVVSGVGGTFAAGADVKEMAALAAPDVSVDRFAAMDRIGRARKPIIAAIEGFALGGGLELALAADLVIAGEDARFGLPEVTLGIIPGYGGTQRLIRSVGKALAMDMILTGRILAAAEAERAGIVSRLAAPGGSLTLALGIAEAVSGFSLSALLLAKEAIIRAQELELGEGLAAERRLFRSAMASSDAKEGLTAFLEKRQPRFGNR